MPISNSIVIRGNLRSKSSAGRWVIRITEVRYSAYDMYPVFLPGLAFVVHALPRPFNSMVRLIYIPLYKHAGC